MQADSRQPAPASCPVQQPCKVASPRCMYITCRAARALRAVWALLRSALSCTTIPCPVRAQIPTLPKPLPQGPCAPSRLHAPPHPAPRPGTRLVRVAGGSRHEARLHHWQRLLRALQRPDACSAAGRLQACLPPALCDPCPCPHPNQEVELSGENSRLHSADEEHPGCGTLLFHMEHAARSAR